MTAPRHAAGLLVLLLGVAAVHLWIGEHLADLVRPWADAGSRRAMPRMRADFVVELAPLAVPPPRPEPEPEPVRRLPRRQPPAPVAHAASAPTDDERTAHVPDPGVPASTIEADAATAAPTDPAPDAPVQAEAEVAPPPDTGPVVVSSPAVAAAAGNASAPTFEWPRSTRLEYRLTGHYRGPVDGTASVEWLLRGTRYQVHVEVSIGPSFAPIVSRRMSSDGEVGPDGLSPRLYEEETRVAWRDPRRAAVHLADQTVRLATGLELPRPPGVQDTASQFVHLTWLFISQPQRLQPGESIELMLALPRRLDPWIYDVLPAETLYTDVGPIQAVPVRPRRLARPQGELSAELWVAPTLGYLPVRFVIRQDEDNHVDLLLDRLPQQEAQPPRAGPLNPARPG